MTPARHLREWIAARARSARFVRRAWAKHMRRRYEHRIGGFLTSRNGRADRLPDGIVYEPTMRCNLRCEFCYVGTLLNIEGEWRQELALDELERAFPARNGLRVNLTGGEIFMRKDILDVLALFRSKGYVCGYLTTNGVLIDEPRAEALADLACSGFLRHVSVSIDGPKTIHDVARGVVGTFERTAAGLKRLQAAAVRKGAPLGVGINTTVARESLEALDRMVDVACELGVKGIGLNHLMFATAADVAETAQMLGIKNAAAISTFVTDDPGVTVDEVRAKVDALRRKCREKGMLFDSRPKVTPSLTEAYYTPGATLDGRCLYPFLHARVSFSGKVYFCPFIRIEVGDLTNSSLEEVWNGERYVELRRRLIQNRLFPVCRRCCKVELAPGVRAPSD